MILLFHVALTEVTRGFSVGRWAVLEGPLTRPVLDGHSGKAGFNCTSN